ARLDIDWRHVKKARDRGVKISVNTDAHRVTGLDYLPYGIGCARKGWLRREDVLNTLELDAFRQYLHTRRNT
ncbi:MAG: DNA polymerase (family 10), partial [Candidatus Latescibacterota bacterium]